METMMTRVGGALLRQRARRLDAVQLRHRDVHQHDVGLELRHAPQRFLAVADLAHDGDVARRLQQRLQAVAQQDVIVGDDDAYRHASES